MQYAEISPFGQYVFTEPENLWYNIIVAGLLIFIGSALSVKHLLYRPVQILYITYPRREERLEFMVIYPITERTAKLREAAVANQYSPEIFAQRDYWFYRGVLSCEESAGRMECISAGLCSVLEYIRPLIFEGERIVGYNFADKNVTSVFFCYKQPVFTHYTKPCICGSKHFGNWRIIYKMHEIVFIMLAF